MRTLKHMHVKDIFGGLIILGAGKYLGLPSMIKRNKKAIFN